MIITITIVTITITIATCVLMFLFVNEVVLSAFCIEASSLKLMIILMMIIYLQGLLKDHWLRRVYPLKIKLGSVKKQEKRKNPSNMAKKEM